jgi:hypothetical protein
MGIGVMDDNNWDRKWLVLHRSWLGFNPAGEVGDLVVKASALSHELANLTIRMHYRCVITSTKSLADLWQRQIGEFPTQVH